MLKKTIQYDDFDDNPVSEDFYFHYTKLEAAELELRVGGIEETIEAITKAQDAQEAYALFKDILVSSVGRKSPDGKRFVKNDEIRADFESSPALGELVFELLQNPGYAAEFVQGILPKKMVEAAQADDETARKLQEQIDRLNSNTGGFDAPPVQPEAPVAPAAPASTLKKLAEYSREELLELSDEDFDKVAGTDPSKMNKATLMVAFERKNAKKVNG